MEILLVTQNHPSQFTLHSSSSNMLPLMLANILNLSIQIGDHINLNKLELTPFIHSCNILKITYIEFKQCSFTTNEQQSLIHRQ